MISFKKALRKQKNKEADPGYSLNDAMYNIDLLYEDTEEALETLKALITALKLILINKDICDEQYFDQTFFTSKNLVESGLIPKDAENESSSYLVSIKALYKLIRDGLL